MRCEECIALAEEHFEGGIDERSEARVASHLSSCEACDAEYKLMLREQAAYSHFLLNVEPSPALWENLRADMERERVAFARAGARPEGGASRLRQFFAGLFAAPGRPAAAGFAALLVLVALATLTFIRRGAPDERAALAPGDARGVVSADPGVAQNNSTAPPADSRALVTPTEQPASLVAGPGEGLAAAALKGGARRGERGAARIRASALTRPAGGESVGAWLRGLTGDDAPGVVPASAAAAVSSPPDASDVERHAERVEVALSSFLNSNDGARRSVDVSYEKRRSQELLLQNVLLRQKARGEGDLPREELLARVEPILVEISNLPAQASAEEVRQVKEQLRKRGMVSALRLYPAEGSGQTF
jgi:hypothetical protein